MKYFSKVMFKTILMVILFIAFLNNCSSDPKDKLIGSWMELNKKNTTWEFLSDGTVIIGEQAAGKYEIIDGGRLSIKVSSLTFPLFKFSVSGDTLVFKTEKETEYLLKIGSKSYNDYKTQVEQIKEIRKEIISSLVNIGAMAQQYYRKPKDIGGGGKSFMGWEVPNNLVEQNGATYTYNYYPAKGWQSEKVIIIGKHTTLGNDKRNPIWIQIEVYPNRISQPKVINVLVQRKKEFQLIS